MLPAVALLVGADCGAGRRLFIHAATCHKAHHAQAGQHQRVGLRLWHRRSRRKANGVVTEAIEKTEIAGRVLPSIGADDLYEAGRSRIHFGLAIRHKADANHAQGRAIRVIGLFGASRENPESGGGLKDAQGAVIEGAEVITREALNAIFGVGAVDERSRFRYPCRTQPPEQFRCNCCC